MGNAAAIEAVTFDVGGTLIEPWPSVGQVYAEVAARNGFPNLSAGELQRRFVAAFRKRSPSIHSAKEWAMIVDETFLGLTDQPPSQTFFQELYAYFSQANAWRIYDDVLTTLNALAEGGVPLGIISNWDDGLRPLLNALELTRYFQVIVISCEIGSAKPEPAIFMDAVKQLRVSKAKVLHVGDSLPTDVVGARAAGLNVVQIDRSAHTASDGRIKSLRDLVAMVEIGTT